MSLRRGLAILLRRLAEAVEPEGIDRRRRAASAADGTRYFYLGADVAMTRLVDGHHMFVDPHDRTVATHLIAHGYWERWIHAIVTGLVSPGDRIVEVGANYGYYTLAMALKAGQSGHITAFEANPRLCRLMSRTMEFNGLSDRVDVRNQAANDTTGPLAFSISRTNSGGGHAAASTAHNAADMEQIQVEGVRLDDVIEGSVDFLRMDAEGSEPPILRGAERILQNPAITVVMEWDVFQMTGRASVPDLVDWLSAMGFRFWKIETDETLSPVSPEAMVTLPGCDVVMSRQTPVLVKVPGRSGQR